MKLTKAMAEELEGALRHRRGRLRAEDVVEMARSEDSALHNFIGWNKDDDELAAAYRLSRARLALSMLRLRESIETQRPLARVQDEAQRERLAGMLDEMKKSGARRLINYKDGRADEDGNKSDGYADVVSELANGRERKILRELLRELSDWVGSRALLHPRFHAHMLGVVGEARAAFDPPAGEAA